MARELYKRRALAQAELRSLLDYDPLTGLWRWRRRPDVDWRVNERDAGKPAGTIKDGYLVIMIDGSQYRAHRLAFIYMLGLEPEGDVGHINRDRADCRWANLRAATRSQNHANRARNARNSSGFKGVNWNAATQSWRAKIAVNGKSIHLGLFAAPEEAARAYRDAAIRYYGEFSRAD
jgi:hypothetical protein